MLALEVVRGESHSASTTGVRYQVKMFDPLRLEKQSRSHDLHQEIKQVQNSRVSRLSLGNHAES